MDDFGGQVASRTHEHRDEHPHPAKTANAFRAVVLVEFSRASSRNVVAENLREENIEL
jgi:hypothetical protein